MTIRLFIILAGIFGFIGVAAGAFGAHSLRELITPERMAIWGTAAQYQMIHALALLGCAALADRLPRPWIRVAGWLFIAGIIVFSGSLYLLVLTDRGWLGAITPIGGTAFLLAWVALALAAVRNLKR